MGFCSSLTILDLKSVPVGGRGTGKADWVMFCRRLWGLQRVVCWV
jgi:hypothetical protein